ncbi:MAG: PadR family transcriptional regulator [Promethearchaeota archaeon]
MFSKKIRLQKDHTISVATSLVLMAIDEITEDEQISSKVVYGYQIMLHLKDAFGWKNVKSGTIYPILKKLNQDGYIRKGIGQNPQPESKRQTIYYKITLKGKKLIKQIKELNDEALETALSAGSESKTENEKKFAFSEFPQKNFTKKFLNPFLLNFDHQLSILIEPNLMKGDLLDLENEIIKAQNDLKEFDKYLDGYLNKIRKIKQINE